MGQVKMVSQEAVRAILTEDWDPLNVRRFGVTDEYDSYIAEVSALLVQDNSTAAITALLEEIASVRMLVDLPLSRHRDAAEKLRQLAENQAKEQ